MRIIQGDSLEVLKTLPDESVDSIVTDPPYELGFMGKKWDNTGIAYNVNLWKECLRVLKSGGHLLAFGGTRTYHRMASAIEDAGFEVRDMIEWVYGSGFPKSLNIGKAVDKIGGQSLSWFIDYILKVADEKGISRKELTMLFPSKNGNPTGWLWNKQKTQGITLEQYHKIKEFLQLPFAGITECEREIVGTTITNKTVYQNIGGTNISGEIEITKGTSEWEGWGTALKPAHEPICMARKPLSEKTVAENVLKYGTGGINIDECRVGETGARNNGNSNGTVGSNSIGVYGKAIKQDYNMGRFPANLIQDNSEEVRECFPEQKSNGNRVNVEYKNPNKANVDFGGGIKNDYNDSDNASRFFKSILYYPKASKSERNKGCEGLETSEKFTAGNYSQSPICKDCNLTLNGTNDHSRCSGEVYYKEMESKNTKNNHPTVKPVELMEYLINMVTPKKGTVLDPFMGSGTTGVASKNLSREFVGIEIDPEYYKIAESRINNTISQVRLDGLI
jgi:DNA modification methylase